MWGAGEGQGHPLQKLKIPKRRPSGQRGNEEEGLALRQDRGARRCVEEGGGGGRGAQSPASRAPPGFFR